MFRGLFNLHEKLAKRVPWSCQNILVEGEKGDKTRSRVTSGLRVGYKLTSS